MPRKILSHFAISTRGLVTLFVMSAGVSLSGCGTEKLEVPSKSDSVFRDALSNGKYGPEMVIVPSGSFTMGSPTNEEGHSDDEGPQRTVTISKPFAVGKFEVMWTEWETCVSQGGCDGTGPETEGGDQGWGKDTRPVISVNWNDANAYVNWLSGETGESYRLLSEAEWEFVARAGTSTAFSFGDTISPAQANYDGRYAYNDGPIGEYLEKSAPVGSYPENQFGLFDLHGNVWEWTEDCYNGSHSGAPADGSARTDGDCSRRILRGGSWYVSPLLVRSAFRGAKSPTYRQYNNGHVGFRVARDLDN